MKKVALVFVLAVLAPSLVLAWLAVRSLRDQQFLLERQQSLLDQHLTDSLAQSISDYLAQQQQNFGVQVDSLAATNDAGTLSVDFDEQLRRHWPLAEVGFCVTTSGRILSPEPGEGPVAQRFRLDNGGFLGNREPVEVYLTANNLNANVATPPSQTQQPSKLGGQSPIEFTLKNSYANSTTPAPQQRQQLNSAPAPVTNAMPAVALDASSVSNDPSALSLFQNLWNAKAKAAAKRKVSPQSQIYQNTAASAADDAQNNLSKVVPLRRIFASSSAARPMVPARVFSKTSSS